MNTAAMIEKAKFILNVQTDAQLAVAMQMSGTQLANIDAKQLRSLIIDIAVERSISIDWILDYSGSIPNLG